ncbi:hypothetical protein PINS_up009573 [Pythium insidiosum]|nr:hypothetical protein PINS_up009573 [Pythium insidiosum]
MVSIGTRSPVYGRHGMVATSQPLASEIGLRILRAGGNAVDAAIAIAAALSVTEPCSTGIGGDCFVLFYDASTRQVQGINGSGRSPAALTMERARADFAVAGDATLPAFVPRAHGHSVTVPGAVAGWVDAVDKWGSMPLAELLAPAIALAKDGFPVSPITAHGWARGKHQLDRSPPRPRAAAARRACAARRRDLSQSDARGVARGHRGRRQGRLLQGSRGRGDRRGRGTAGRRTDARGPRGTRVDGRDAHQDDVPWRRRARDPAQRPGIVALLALNILNELLPEGADDSNVARDSPEYLHLVVEALRLAFADAQWYVSDLEHNPQTPVDALLSREYARARAALIDRSRALVDPTRGSPELSCDTVSFQVVDAAGNAVSMVNSNYEGFGTGFVPRGCGFTLQNRGSNFRLDDAGHPNALAPCKRPYHTIIPAISTFADDSQALHATFSVMGAFMQPQGHVQVLCNLLVHGLDPQEAIDAPRVCVDAKSGATGESRVLLEDGVSPETAHALATRFGHVIETRAGVGPRSVFGRGQIIVRDRESGVLCAGSDGRADGCAMGW